MRKANWQWAFVTFLSVSSYVELLTLNNSSVCKLIGAKKGGNFQLIYFFGLFCAYDILHNYVIPWAMPHATPQTHSAFYPQRPKSQ